MSTAVVVLFLLDLAKALYNKIQYTDDERITHLLIAIVRPGLL